MKKLHDRARELREEEEKNAAEVAARSALSRSMAEEFCDDMKDFAAGAKKRVGVQVSDDTVRARDSSGSTFSASFESSADGSVSINITGSNVGQMVPVDEDELLKQTIKWVRGAQ